MWGCEEAILEVLLTGFRTDAFIWNTESRNRQPLGNGHPQKWLFLCKMNDQNQIPSSQDFIADTIDDAL